MNGKLKTSHRCLVNYYLSLQEKTQVICRCATPPGGPRALWGGLVRVAGLRGCPLVARSRSANPLARVCSSCNALSESPPTCFCRRAFVVDLFLSAYQILQATLPGDVPMFVSVQPECCADIMSYTMNRIDQPRSPVQSIR